MYNNEIWVKVPIIDYEDYYEISNYGRLKTIKTGRIRKPVNRNGYCGYELSACNIRKMFSAHRLVALAFISNPNNLSEVNHIDGNKHNNHVSNLEWCDRQYNEYHAVEEGLCKYAKPVIATNIDTGEVLEFPSMKQCAEYFNAYKRAIEAVLQGRRKTHKRHRFEYKNPEDRIKND